MPKEIAVIILAGGKGTRFNSQTPKQFFKIFNKTLLEINIEKFLSIKNVVKIIIVSETNFLEKTKKITKKYNLDVIEGGKTRQLSVKNGLIELNKNKFNYVAIHDCARPFFDKSLFKKLLDKVSLNNCSIPILEISDSLMKVDSISKLTSRINRENLFSIQTPQIFPFKKILHAHKNSLKKKFTDDSAIAEEIKLKIKTIEGSKYNIKITTKEDIDIAKMIYMKQEEIKYNNRVGMGFDVHAFEDGTQIILCGIKIPFTKKLKGHSDADVGFHAIVDAILGSIGEGDIGEHFPPNQKKWKDSSSEIFMKFSKELLEKKNAKIQSIDLTLICEKPKIIPYKKLMVEKISKIMDICGELINIKATTTEKLGFTGREEGIAAQAIVSTKIIDGTAN